MLLCCLHKSALLTPSACLPCLPYPPCPTPAPSPLLSCVQIAACPEVTVVSTADVSAEVLEKEKAIEMGKEDIKSKPEAIRWVLAWRQRDWQALTTAHVRSKVQTSNLMLHICGHGGLARTHGTIQTEQCARAAAANGAASRSQARYLCPHPVVHALRRPALQGEDCAGPCGQDCQDPGPAGAALHQGHQQDRGGCAPRCAVPPLFCAAKRCAALCRAARHAYACPGCRSPAPLCCRNLPWKRLHHPLGIRPGRHPLLQPCGAMARPRSQSPSRNAPRLPWLIHPRHLPLAYCALPAAV